VSSLFLSLSLFSLSCLRLCCLLSREASEREGCVGAVSLFFLFFASFSHSSLLFSHVFLIINDLNHWTIAILFTRDLRGEATWPNKMYAVSTRPVMAHQFFHGFELITEFNKRCDFTGSPKNLSAFSFQLSSASTVMYHGHFWKLGTNFAFFSLKYH
jgi:hypothetical protein